jgi:hypothetical protein
LVPPPETRTAIFLGVDMDSTPLFFGENFLKEVFPKPLSRTFNEGSFLAKPASSSADARVLPQARGPPPTRSAGMFVLLGFLCVGKTSWKKFSLRPFQELYGEKIVAKVGRSPADAEVLPQARGPPPTRSAGMFMFLQLEVKMRTDRGNKYRRAEWEGSHAACGSTFGTAMSFPLQG